MTAAEVMAIDPEDYKEIGTGSDIVRGGTGETFSGLQDRISAAIAELADRHRTRTIGVVSHGAATRAFVAGILGLEFADRQRPWPSWQHSNGEGPVRVSRSCVGVVGTSRLISGTEMRLLLITNDFPPACRRDSAISGQPRRGPRWRGDGARARRIASMETSNAPASSSVATGGGSCGRRRECGVGSSAKRSCFPPMPCCSGRRIRWPGTRAGSVVSLGVHVAILCHGAEITAPALLPIARQLVRRSLRGADVLLAVSRFTARRVERLTDRPAVYIGSGVDADLFFACPRTLWEAGDQGDNLPIVGCVSRFVPRKGQHRLIRAAAILRKRGTPVQLLLVGAGRRLAALQRLAARRRVPTRFEVGVDWSALPDFYREMDVFCMPCRSRWGGLEAEGLGIVYLEAGAAGLPVLAGDSGGAPETVDQGRDRLCRT